MSAAAGKVCVVTGAASGIGRALAAELARRGARGVAISDVDEDGLAETAAVLSGTEVHSARLDVSDRAAVAAYASQVAGHFGVVHQIYNNAGIAGGGPVAEVDYALFERILSINLWGVIHGTKEFLPHLIASGDGHVVNISSLNGIMAQADLSAYCASKFAVRGFTESLALEMDVAGHPVRVTVVHPGGVRTNIATAALDDDATDEMRARVQFMNERVLRMDAGRAARIIVGGVERDRARVLVGNDARALDALVRTAPRRWPRILLPLMRRVTPKLT